MRKILIVEDERLIRQGMTAMIRRSGIAVEEILEATNGEAALELMKSNQFDVIFTDIRMPRMDGLQLVKEVQKLASPPVMIAVSGYDEFNYAVEMLRSGVREYILKPVERERLFALLDRLDAEIREKNRAELLQRSIGIQQLKYWLLNEYITDGETENVIRNYHGSFFDNDFVVCCTNNTKGDIIAGDQYIYLSGVEAHELYIIKEKEALNIWEQKLQGRYVGISARHRGLRELKSAFREAAAARKCAFWQEQKMFRYKPEREDDGTAMPEKEIYQIVQQMGTDQEAAARRRIGELFYRGRRGACQAEDLEKSIGLILKLLWELYGNIMGEVPDTEELFGSLYGHECAEKLERMFNQWLDRLSEKLREDFNDYRNKQKIKQAILYINENYDTDLNMAMVSNEISMNYSLFSHSFKLYTGSKFVDYIKELRIREAQKLLATTELRIHEISRKIGYENEKHFMKTFKGVCGVSPTEYRKKMLYKGNTIQ